MTPYIHTAMFCTAFLLWDCCIDLVVWNLVLQNLHVKVEFPEKYFQLLFSSQNGTYHVVNTVHKGFTNLYGELKAVMMTASILSVLRLHKLTIRPCILCRNVF